jgi:hypothetical protein
MNITENIQDAAAQYPSLEAFSTGGGCDFIGLFPQGRDLHTCLVLMDAVDGTPDKISDPSNIVFYPGEQWDTCIDVGFVSAEIALKMLASPELLQHLYALAHHQFATHEAAHLPPGYPRSKADIEAELHTLGAQHIIYI